MDNLGSRIQTLRKQKNISQIELGQEIGVSKSQINRYENKEVQPPADILKKLADIFNTSIDFLVYGDSEQKAKQLIQDNDLLAQFRAVEELDQKDKKTIKEVIDAMIKRSKLKNIAAL